MERILYGKNNMEGVVCIEWKDGDLIIFTEGPLGVEKYVEKHKPYTLFDSAIDTECRPLEGHLPLKFYKKYDSEWKQNKEYQKASYNGYYVWKANNTVEGAMISKGYTFFLGRKPTDISILSFDIETVGINPLDEDSKILSIASTYRKGTITENRLFAYDEYRNEENMVLDFADYIRKVDPSIITGYNILGFDIPFIVKRHKKFRIGRDRSSLQIEEKTREKRKDASQSYSFNACHAFGRQIIDAFHLVIDYDLSNSRLLPSYKLKEVMAFLGLEKKNRQHYDASKIRETYKNETEWQKIKEYNKDDGEDALKLLDYVWEPYFYFSNFIPMTFERMTQTATGTKVNNLMLRAYLQDRHSIPVSDKKQSYTGGLVAGDPGLFNDVNKVDVQSMYPSIMIMKDLCVQNKDPKRIFPMITKSFTESRLKDKKRYTETGDKYYDSQQAAKKIFINSLYGFLGAPGLNFNSMKAADMVTEEGREITKKGMEWAKEKGWLVINADTDSFSYSTGKHLSVNEFSDHIKELNSLYPNEIKWTNDGQYETILVLKRKNYVLVDYNGKRVDRGNSIKATMKEPALKSFINELICALISRKDKECLLNIYFKYAKSITEINSEELILPWCSKITVSKSVLESNDTRPRRIREALAGGNYKEADKALIFFKKKDELCRKENFDGLFSEKKLLEKLYATTKVFREVIDYKMFPNLALKKNSSILERIRTNNEA